MHELSIVEALIDQVGKELDRAGQPGRVARLELSIGRLSGVNCDSVRFAFRLLAPGTVVEDAEIVIQRAQGRLPLPRLRARRRKSTTSWSNVPAASGEIAIEGGREMVLQSIEIED